LIMKNTVFAAMEFSRCAQARTTPTREDAAQRAVSQNSTARGARGRHSF
jgi:hypothetical protein